MKVQLDKQQVGAVAPRLALASALIAAGVLTAAQHAQTGRAATLGSTKPNYRADTANTGQIPVKGPGTLPALYSTFQPNVPSDNFIGTALDTAGNVLVFDNGNKTAYSYTPASPTATQKWAAPLGSGTAGVIGGFTSNFALSDDGNAYYGTDNGKLNQISLATGASAGIFNTVAADGIETTAAIAPDNTLYFGDDGSISQNAHFYSVTPGAGTSATNWTDTLTSNTSSTTPDAVFAQAALNGGTVYVGTAETPTSNTAAKFSVGTLYSLNRATGAVNFFKPLDGAVYGSVLFDNKGTHNDVLVATTAGSVYDFDATTGAQNWVRSLAFGTIKAPLSLSLDGNTVYVQDNTALRALNVAASGATVWTVTTTNSAAGAVVDPNGWVFIQAGAQGVFAIDPTGTVQWNLAPSVSANGGSNSVAIGTDASGNPLIWANAGKGKISGYSAPAFGPPATATNTPTNTPPGPTNTATLTPVPPTATSTATNTAVPPTATNTVTNTPVPPTATSTATNTPVPPTSTPTLTSTPNATQTAVAAATQTAIAAAGVAPNCQLDVLPNPETIQVGGSEAILYKVRPGTTITSTILGGSYPASGIYYNGVSATGTTVNGTAVATPAPGGYTYTLVAGPSGRFLLDFPIPAGATLGKVTITTTANKVGCRSNGGPLTRTATFNVIPAQANSFTNLIRESLKHGLIRSVQPTGKGSIVTDKTRVVTAPNANVELVVTTASAGTGAGLEPAFAPGAIIATYNTNANAKGIASFTFPITSTVLIPGKAAKILKTVTIQNAGGSVFTLKTSATIREVRLRLIVQNDETTRGNKRSAFVIGKPHGTVVTTTFTARVLADAGATVNGTLTIGGSTITAGPNTAGVGGRTSLKFSVPDSVTPAKGQATLVTTSTYRGATITRTIHFNYAHKK